MVMSKSRLNIGRFGFWVLGFGFWVLGSLAGSPPRRKPRSTRSEAEGAIARSAGV